MAGSVKEFVPRLDNISGRELPSMRGFWTVLSIPLRIYFVHEENNREFHFYLVDLNWSATVHDESTRYSVKTTKFLVKHQIIMHSSVFIRDNLMYK